jgi:hypothetical protein
MSYKRASVAFGSLVGGRGRNREKVIQVRNPAAPDWVPAAKKEHADNPLHANPEGLSPLRAFMVADSEKEHKEDTTPKRAVTESTKAQAWLRKRWIAFSIAMLIIVSCLVANELVETDMGLNGWLTIGVAGSVVCLLIAGVMTPCVLLFLAISVLLVCKVVTPNEAWAGFSKPLVVAVQLLLVIAKALQESTLLSILVKKIGKPKNLLSALLMLLPPALILSAFITGLTGVVAILTPVVIQWSKGIGIPAKRLLLPMNYAVMLGASTTLLGNSCNLILGSLQENMEPVDGRCAYFDVIMPARAGLPVAIAGLLTIILCAPYLPGNKLAADKLAEKLKLFTATMRVPPGSKLVGTCFCSLGLFPR